jgi:hypothetical protein
MKLAVFFILLNMTSTFAAETVDLAQEDCTRECQVYSYNFQDNGFGLCEQIEKCDVYTWNDENNTCEVVAKGELVTFPIACHDIAY